MDLAPDKATQQVVVDEVASYQRSQQSKRRLMPRAALVGALSGVVGVGFRLALTGAEALRERLLAFCHGHGLPGLVLAMGVLTAGCWVSVLMVRRLAPEAAGSGIPHLKAVLYGLRSLSWRRVFPVKFFGGALGIGSGLALGREGPTTQMGGAIGAMVADWLASPLPERQILIAAGAGAGLAAAFNAPIAGMAFVLEEIQRDFTPAVFSATLIATVVADIVTRLYSGQNPVLPTGIFPTPPVAALLPFAVLGLSAGLLGVLYNHGLIWSLDMLGRRRRLGPVLVGLLVAISAWTLPDMVGGGYHILDIVLTSQMAWGALIGAWLIRYLLTMLSYGSGAPGGIFAPLLVLGALNGLLVGQLTEILVPGFHVEPQVYAVVGMGAYFTAIVRAPLTGILLIVEMTSNFNLTLPLLVASLIAYIVAEALKDTPIYEALLERDLSRTQEHPHMHAPYEFEFIVQAASEYDGKTVRTLGLPEGCVLVTLKRGVEDILPNGNTRLQAGDRIRTVVAANASHLVYQLKKGAGL